MLTLAAASKSVWDESQSLEQRFWTGECRQPERFLEHLGYNARVFRFVKPWLKEVNSSRALEVGIGAMGIGCLSPFLGHEIELTAIDPLPLMEMEIHDPALRAYAHNLRQRFEFICCPGESLPFPDERFGIVACDNVLDHCQDPMKVLREMSRVLARQGILLLTLNTFSLLGRLRFEMNRRYRPNSNHTLHPHSYTHRHIEDALRTLSWQILDREAPKRRQSLTGGSFFSIWVLRKT